MKKKTNEEYVSEVREINEYIEVLEPYVGDAIKINHKCKKCGNIWKSTPSNILQGSGCRPCSYRERSQKRIKSHEQYVKEVENINKYIEVVEPYISNMTKIKHRCKVCGNIWMAKPNNILSGKGCPECDRENKTSYVELIIYYYIKKYFLDAVSGYKNILQNISELDIYIPSQKFAIEYDGGIYHKNTERDKRKDKICKTLGIKLIRIREPECPEYESDCEFIILYKHSYKELQMAIEYILEILGINNSDINISRDIAEINDLIVHSKKENSLAKLRPDIAKEWHPIKNGNLAPEYISCCSHKYVWWLCSKCGYEWAMAIDSRTSLGYGCKRCARERTRKASCKAVYCIELCTVFESQAEAYRKLNVRNIRKNIIGEYPSAGKHPITGESLHWKYLYDQHEKDGSVIQGAISIGLITEEEVLKQLN